MLLIPNDTVGIAKGRKTPKNAELVDLVQARGEVTVFLFGDIKRPLKLVKKPDAGYQAFGATEADRKICNDLHQANRTLEIPVTLVGH